jgi:hypothetical protein
MFGVGRVGGISRVGGLRRLRQSVASFNPATLFTGTDTGWVYDLSDMSTLFQDAAGTTPVTAVGQPVGRCLDLSGKGNHRTQSTALNRPTYARHPLGGIRNLLTRTEQFDNAAWTDLGGIIRTADTDVAPDSTTSADTVEATSINRNFSQGTTQSYSAGLDFTASIYVKKTTSATTFPFFSLNRTSSPTRFSSCILNTNTGVVTGRTGGSQFGTNFTSISDGDYWRVSFTLPSIEAGTQGLSIYPAASTDGTTFVNVTGSTILWGAQLELGSTATAYQRVGSTFDVTEAGVPDLYYLSYDGINDSLATASFAWGTDKATVVAGVRKLSDAARRTLVEHTASIDANNGGFHLTAPNAASATFAFESKGTTLTDAVASSVAAPTTRVLTGIGDIAGDSAIIRLDGSVVDTDTGDQGSGNYASAVNHFGARAGTSLFFNGREYSNVGINRLLTTGELAALESWTAGKNGVTIL